MLDTFKNPEIEADFSYTVSENLAQNQTEENFHKQWRNMKTNKTQQDKKENPRAIKCAKEQWFGEKLQEMERFKDTNIKEMFKNVRKIARKGPLPTLCTNLKI